MNKIIEELKRYVQNPVRYTIKNKAIIVDTDNGRFVFKENNGNDQSNLYQYLKSRSFNYFPEITNNIKNYDMYKYIDDIDIPKEQKANDLIHLLALLHNKTTYYKKINLKETKKIFEELNSKINYLFKYYESIITIIEEKKYMSPSEYLLARNISIIFSSLNFCKDELEKWYKIKKKNIKERLVTIHGNPSLEHIIENNQPFLISWQNSKEDNPIYDFIKLYNYNYPDIDYSELLKEYEKKYPLLDDERKLMFIILSIPPKIELIKDEYQMCSIITKHINKIYETRMLILPYYSES